MSSPNRTRESEQAVEPPSLTRQLTRELIPLGLGLGLVGVSFGALAVSYGMPWWVAVLLSSLVFAGGAQFLAIGVVAAGGGLIAAVAGALILNARHLPYGLAISQFYDHGWFSRYVGSHLLLDQSTAFVLAYDHDPQRARTAFWATGITVFVVWNVGTLIGVFGGQAIGDPDAFGLDAALPAALIALVLPSMKSAPAIRAALLGAAIALATTPFLPPGLPVLCALLGLLVASPKRRSDTKKEAPEA